MKMFEERPVSLPSAVLAIIMGIFVLPYRELIRAISTHKIAAAVQKAWWAGLGRIGRFFPSKGLTPRNRSLKKVHIAD